MNLTPEIEAKGLKAYEQVRAYEQLSRRRLPLIYACISTVWIIVGLWAWGVFHSTYTALILISGIFSAIITWVHGVKLKEAYRQNLELITGMEKTYGDALSWVQVEKHFAALEKIQQEEREKQDP